MPKLDDFFRTKAEPLHPRIRYWEKQLESPDTTAFLEFHQPKGMFGQEKPEMYLHFSKGGKEDRPEPVFWDDDLNTGLIRLKVKSVTTDQEANRFALGLRAAMRKAESEFGDGYFNAVLVEFIKESDLTKYDKIKEIIPYTYANKPFQEGKAYDRYSMCRDLIDGAISGRANELTTNLGYAKEDAKGILVSALAQYLDDRFSISARREFGML